MEILPFELKNLILGNLEKHHLAIVKHVNKDFSKLIEKKLGSHTFYDAALHNEKDILVWGIDLGHELDDYTLTCACKGGHLELAKWIMCNGINPTSFSFTDAISSENIELINYLYNNYWGYIIVNSEYGHEDDIGATFNCGNYTYNRHIKTAFKTNNFDIIKIILNGVVVLSGQVICYAVKYCNIDIGGVWFLC